MAAESPERLVFGNPAVSRWPPSRAYHVKNYRLAIHFDIAKGEVFGDEIITLQPFANHFRKFYLNSAELAIDAVTVNRAQGAALKLNYAIEGHQLWITLDRDYEAWRTLRVRIVYHGFPRTGLFFVHPTPEYPNWPSEVYSQGEPELNQYWFPCWDYPNDMATSETVTTVPEGQVVVSNGKLVRMTHAGGQVTYDWVESIPHSSYLISIASGPWRKFSDKYEGKPVDYYVPRTVDEATARRSFHLTPDMIGFFSRATGVEYPYEQYAQTAVQNFIFGGQENVSATTLTDTTLHDERADQDYPSTDLVSHELGQHWFGDFVQCRDWANIWLNEGFATYLEALYTQYHAGNDAYRFAIYQDQLSEQEEDRSAYRRPIVDRHYNDPLAMFDATTHEKGAAVLEMLRYVVDGSQAVSHTASQDERLFRAFHNYLTTHQAQAVETKDLMEAIQKTTGEELGWFFHEWVFMSGHPDYRVTASYDASSKTEKLTILQTQPITSQTPIFEMPIELAFFGANGERKQIQVHDYMQQQTFDIPLDFAPQWADFDPDDFIDKTVQFDRSLPELIAQSEKDPSMMSRLWAVQQMGSDPQAEADLRVDVLAQVLNRDSFYGVRAEAATSLGKFRTEKTKAVLLSALQQPDSRVRKAVVASLGNFSQAPPVYSALVDVLKNDRSYAVEAEAAKVLGKSGQSDAFDVLKAKIETPLEIHVMRAVLEGLAATKDDRAAETLFAYTRLGVTEQIRLTALASLESVPDSVARDHAPELREAVRTALRDPFYPVQEVAEELIGFFHLSQFEGDVQAQADGAPMAMQRERALKVLDQLHQHK